MKAEQAHLETIKGQIEQCEAEARRHGWEGARYEPTPEDCEAIVRALGYRPTRAEWASAGVYWVGDAHAEGGES